MSVPAPTVPATRLAEDGWERIEDTERTFLESPMVTVRSRFVLYEDQALRDAIREETGIDQLWRSFFASRLQFAGPITVGLGTIVETLVRPQATSRFVRDLESRGFQSVERRESRRISIDSSHEASAIEYTLVYPISRRDLTDDLSETGSASDHVPGAGWLVIWAVDSDVLLSGGTYPREAFDAVKIDATTNIDLQAYRTELFELIRAVRP